MSSSLAPVDPAQALSRLWSGVRVVVVDTETCPDPAKHAKDHVISIGAVTLQRGVTTGSWATLLDPGVPITNTRHHNLTDNHVAGAPTFAEVADHLDGLLASDSGEVVVFVGHNPGFDVTRLGWEYHRLHIKRNLPDVPVVDTSRLARFLGVSTPDKSLATLAGTLGIGNPNPHDALSDALTTAAVLTKLVETAAGQGLTDMAALVEGAKIGDRSVTPGVQVPPHPGDITEAVAVVPMEHLASHTHVLSPRAGKHQIARWLEGAGPCVELRCPHLHDKAKLTTEHPSTARAVAPGLTRLVATAIATGQPGQVATALDALCCVLPLTLSADRALALYDRFAAGVAKIGRCDPTRLDACPACRSGLACPVDTWHQVVALAYASALTTAAWRARFTSTSLPAWATAGRAPLAGYVAWLAAEQWSDAGDTGSTNEVAAAAWADRVYEPRLIELHAEATAAVGTSAALLRGVKVCDRAFKHQHGSTDGAWEALGAKRRQLSSRRAVLLGEIKDQTTGTRRHEPATPHRQHVKRFALQ